MKSVSVLKKETAQDPIPLVEISADGYQEPLIVSTYGDPGVGKSYLIGSAPGDIGVIPMEHKSRQSILKSAEKYGRKVIMPDRDLIRTGNPMLISLLPAACVSEDKFAGKNYRPEDLAKLVTKEMDAIAKEIRLDGPQPNCCAVHYYKWHFGRVKSVAFRMAADDGIKTIAIDTFGQLIEDCLFSNYGRTDKIIPLEKKSFNQEVRDFLNAISHKNLILTHHASAIWRDNKPTSKTKPTSSFAKIGHYTSVAVHQWRDDSKAEGDGRYGLAVEDCQANAALIGLDLLFDSDISFTNLAMQVYPESDPSDWE